MSVLLSSSENAQASRSFWSLFIFFGEMLTGFCCFVSFSGAMSAAPLQSQHQMQLYALGMIVVLLGMKIFRMHTYSWVLPVAFFAGMFAACHDYRLRSLILALISVSVVHSLGFLLWRAYHKKA